MIVGLGNPGPRYKDTRHNIGFRIVDLWSQDLKVGLTSRARRGFESRYVRTKYKDRDIILLCPLTYMNRSGKSVRGCADYYKLESRRILVIHDDADLPVGRIKVVRQGGAGGHKGVLSVIEHLGDRQFPRVRIGAGRPRFDENMEDFVLSPFYSDEKDVVEKVVRMAVKACEFFVLEGIQAAMTHINCLNLAEKEE
ncbi:MAG: aminoacyl-tRNA hydrolase [Deltaproteobacteria bacterium]|nr:aminoacyl-tRNA hydrolase [Deltaproteobacteria bacterium]